MGFFISLHLKAQWYCLTGKRPFVQLKLTQKFLSKCLQNVLFYVVSDDLEWCRATLEAVVDVDDKIDDRGRDVFFAGSLHKFSHVTSFDEIGEAYCRRLNSPMEPMGLCKLRWFLDVKLNIILYMLQSMWPDLASTFRTKVAKIFASFQAFLQNVTFSVFNSVDSFWAWLEKNWATFCFYIWSHRLQDCKLTTSVVQATDKVIG